MVFAIGLIVAVAGVEDEVEVGEELVGVGTALGIGALPLGAAELGYGNGCWLRRGRRVLAADEGE